MRALYKKVIIIILLIAVLLLTSCEASTTPNVDTPTITSFISNTPEVTGNVKPKELRPLQYYSLSETTQEKEAKTALISSQDVVTPEFILTLVADAMDELGIDVVIDFVKTVNEKVYISFSSSSGFLKDIDNELEIEILDAVAQSILDNFTEYSKVIYQIDGGAYSSSNNYFDGDEVYLERKTN